MDFALNEAQAAVQEAAAQILTAIVSPGRLKELSISGEYLDRTAWQGTYFSVLGGQPMETWVARMCGW